MSKKVMATTKNGVKNPKRVLNGPKFDKDNQPTPEAKKAGWERRREAQRIMDTMLNIVSMTVEQLKKLQVDVKEHPENHTVQEVMLIKYLGSEKYIVDYLDRHISKAPQQTDITSGGKEIFQEVKITIVKPDGKNS